MTMPRRLLLVGGLALLLGWPLWVIAPLLGVVYLTERDKER